jgi:2-methylcitrate dehydratase PrpD
MAHAESGQGSGAPDFNEVFARFAAGLDAGALPEPLLAAARLNVFDTLACSIAGYRAPGVQEVIDVVQDWGGKPEAQVLWTDLRVPAPNAAWFNGVAAHACDYDDTHDKAILHGGISVIPAALAAADIAGRPVSGADFYAGVIAGLELICRIGVATKIDLIRAGFIYSALFSCFASAAAAARILRLTPEETVNAVGIAFSQAAGTHQVTRDAAVTKRMQPGFGARAGLTAVALARRGVRGAQRVFEGEDGLGRIYLQSQLDSAVLREGLGERFHFADLAYKPYPCCRMNHCAIDAALELRARPGFDWRKVTEIRALVNYPGFQAVGTPLEMRRAPKQVVQAQFSICYTIACALIHGRVGLSDFTSEALARPDVLSLAARVTPSIDAELDRRFGRNVTPARVEAVMDGVTHKAEVLEAKGGAETPMSDRDLRLKLEDCLLFGGFDPGKADLFEQAIAGLTKSSDVSADVRVLSATIAASAGGASRRAA